MPSRRHHGGHGGAVQHPVLVHDAMRYAHPHPLRCPTSELTRSRNAQSVCRRLGGQEIRAQDRSDCADICAGDTSGYANPGRCCRQEDRDDDHSGYAVHHRLRRPRRLHVRRSLTRASAARLLTSHRSLVVNIIATELVEASRRTAVFGRLQGCIMLGNGIGYLGLFPSPGPSRCHQS